MCSWVYACIEEFDLLGPKWQKHLQPWESLKNRVKWSFANTNIQYNDDAEALHLSHSFYGSYQLACTVKLGCS